MMSRGTLLLVAVVLTAAVARAQPAVYDLVLKTPETLKPFLPLVEPGNDAFAAEKTAAEIEARLAQFGDRLRRAPARAGDALADLLAPAFKGGTLVDPEPTIVSDGPLLVRRARAADLSAVAPAKAEAPPPHVDATRFRDGFTRWLGGLAAIDVTEFQVVAIDRPDGEVTTDVRFDLVGRSGSERVEHVGEWRLRWRRDGEWQIAEWTRLSHVESRAKAPAFTEVTHAALGGIPSFQRQLAVPLDQWNATIDSVLTRDSNGHHGVSVGDADGDGLEDLYIAQPAGLPNRLYRARGDGTFEDISEQAGVHILDDTAQSLFADVDNDGDQDLVLATGTRLLLLVNDGTGRFADVPDAFAYARPLTGVLTSIAMADYDRDGFSDLYVCVYAYFFGAGDDKAGTPAPYYDARNGPPGVLFRNDGRGRFVEATADAGLDAGNDRYHFAAAWADYDGDGWPDLLVANDFGTKNLYRNLGRQGTAVRFEDVSERAGVLDHGAGMSAAFLDYDNDGRLDIYTGNMWSAAGRRVTASPAFMPEAPADVRALYRRHARGNSLFRNLGDGRFEDRTLASRTAMGRWAWSSDALDFDSDGFDDLYVANGMLTRAQGPRDLDGFFWRQVVARSPLTRAKGTPYDDAWQAINQLLVHQSIASRQRNVLLRNDGRGGFDEVSGAAGLDLDQDGRSFAVLDLDRDGDPDLAVMAARQTPHLRIFRNDLTTRTGADGAAALTVKLTGTASNRDALGAVVTVDTDTVRRTKVVSAGSGFLSQHSRELVFGLGRSRGVSAVTVAWPSGRRDVFEAVPLNSRVLITEGEVPRVSPLATSARPMTAGASAPAAAPPSSTWLYEPFPLPAFQAPDLNGTLRSSAALAGKPALVLLWTVEDVRARQALDALSAGAAVLDRAGIGRLAMALDDAGDEARVRALAPPALPTVLASRATAVSFAIVNRFLYMNRQPLRLPTAFLLDPGGRIVKVYRDGVDVTDIARDAAALDVDARARLARAVPFAGLPISAPAVRNYVPYGGELLDEGLDAAALDAFERAAQSSPTAFTLYRLGTLLERRGETARARAAFERALSMQPDLAEASNDLGTLLARGGDLQGAITRFRAALAASPDYPDALNNLGYAMLLGGADTDARRLYERALELQPDFPEALNNLGMLVGRAGALEQAEGLFRRALERRPAYGEAAANLALVLVARGQAASAVAMLEKFVSQTPDHEGASLALARIHFSQARDAAGIAVLERLLQRNPTSPAALELLRQFKPR
jgi:Tfp pilus assembly protein PilF